jgi:hypothetical protein
MGASSTSETDGRKDEKERDACARCDAVLDAALRAALN